MLVTTGVVECSISQLITKKKKKKSERNGRGRALELHSNHFVRCADGVVHNYCY